MREGALAWVKNPISGVVSYVADLQDKNFAYTLGSHLAASVPPLDEGAIRQTVAACPFCPGNEARTFPPEIMRLAPAQFVAWEGPRDAAWVLRAFKNLFPRIPPELTGGRNESYLVVEDPRHYLDSARDGGDLTYTGVLAAAQFVEIIRMCAAIGAQARANPAVRSVVVRKNQGRESGASQPHVHQQIIGAPADLPALAAERGALAVNPRLFQELADLAERCGLMLERDEELAVYLSPVGTFPHSYDIVMPHCRQTLDRLPAPMLERFARALHQVLGLVGAQPLDYEIHQAEGLPLHAHVNVRRFPYSNVAGTLVLPKRMLESVAAFQRARYRR